ncbi:hypothetical protein TNCT_516021 [Trichonephila clavata]|uniref:Uncharacterized protein n=2 Tax=Trichonephila clavata TaxID=2740835 RepID=A0A8X6K9G4_TRICU|nr:hypothetical protein TNCT_516021 [Trichonephila clavata]
MRKVILEKNGEQPSRSVGLAFSIHAFDTRRKAHTPERGTDLRKRCVALLRCGRDPSSRSHSSLGRWHGNAASSPRNSRLLLQVQY